MKYISLLLMFSATLTLGKTTKEVVEFLQDISVTIKSENRYSKSEGSGVLIVKKVEGEDVTFVLTAAHVVDNLRSIRTVVDEDGGTRKVVEFKDAQVVKELVESGRRVGEIKMDAQVIKYSDYTHGHDIALLMVRSRDYGKVGAKFYRQSDQDHIVSIGTPLYHVGSLLGQMGANSMTTGIVSQVGRIADGVEFDQTTVTAFPGSSGGGVYLTNGQYVGMLVRGAGENFNLMAPIRRIYGWAEESGVSWILDASAKAPPLKEIETMPIERSGFKAEKDRSKKSLERVFTELPFLIKTY